jgi:hypothetical protein
MSVIISAKFKLSNVYLMKSTKHFFSFINILYQVKLYKEDGDASVNSDNQYF